MDLGDSESAGFLADLSSQILDGQIALFLGAGISKNSGLPVATELQSTILGKLEASKDDVDIILNSGLPFESFFEMVSERIDIATILKIFRMGRPNTNHRFLAKLAGKGHVKTIATTNFDSLMEEALRQEGMSRNRDFVVLSSEDELSHFRPSDALSLLKVHGTSGNLETIRIVLSDVAKKSLSDARRTALRHVFQDGDHSTVLILGYSCSDFFDISPQLRKMKTSKKQILLIEHKHDSSVLEVQNRIVKDPFSSFDGKTVRIHTDCFVKLLWSTMISEIGPYKEHSYRLNWKKNVTAWRREASVLDSRMVLYELFQALPKPKMVSMVKSDQRLLIRHGPSLSRRSHKFLSPDLHVKIKVLDFLKHQMEFQGKDMEKISLAEVSLSRGELELDSHPDRAIIHLHAASNLFGELHSKARSHGGEGYTGQQLCAANTLLATAYFFENDGPRTKYYNRRAFRLARQIGDVQAELNTRLLSAYLREREYVNRSRATAMRVADNYLVAFDLAGRLGQVAVATHCLYQIGQFFRRINQDKIAVKMFTLAIQKAGQNHLKGYVRLCEDALAGLWLEEQYGSISQRLLKSGYAYGI